MTVFLHIGTHKTGTTAIQRFLNANRAELADRGCLAPDFGMPASHPLAWGVGFGLRPPPEETVAQHLKLSRRLLTDAATRAAEDGKNILLSSEVFCEFMNDPDSIGRLKDLLGECGLTDIRIICYCRRQDHFAESLCKELIKGFHPRQLAEAFSDWYMDYHRLLDHYAEAFGADAIIVRPFETEQFADGDLFSDFLSVLGLTADDGYALPSDDDSNVSLGPDIVELLRLYGSIGLGDETPDDPGGWLKRVLLTSFDRGFLTHRRGDAPLLSPRQRIELIDKYDTSNQAVARDYLGRVDGQLFLEPLPNADEAWQPYPGLTVETLAPLLLKILVQQQADMDRMAGELYSLRAKPLFDAATEEVGHWEGESLLAAIESHSEAHLRPPEIEDGLVVLESTGYDPSVVMAPLPVEAQSGYVLRLTIHLPVNATCELFCTTDRQPYFSNDASLAAHLTAGWHVVYWALPDDFSGSLRIDPGDCTGRFRIRDLTVRKIC